MGKWLKSFCVILFLYIPLVSADQVVVNSQDWTDIYSGIIYSGINNDKGSYIIDEGHGLLLQEELNPAIDTTIIESVEQPYIRNYNINLESKGFTTEVIFAEENLNLEFARSIDTSGYIILDQRYSYNAVSVAPYAVRKKYYVIFADAENIDEVVEVLSLKDSPEIIIYGFVDREVTTGLSEFNPTIINIGNKFSNNLEILKLFVDEFESNQLILTNGEFLEPQFFIGNNPVLFIGNTNIPDETIDFLSTSEIKHAILIGYDIFDNAVTLKNKMGMKIIVKFAKGVDSKQYALDIFQLPKEEYSIGISSVSYNTFSRQLEVAYFNIGDFPAFLKGSHNILLNNNSMMVVGDEEAIFIASEETLTMTYDADLSQTDGLTLRSNILYGEDRGALEFLLIIDISIDIISYEDKSDIEISDVYYDRQTKRINIKIKNTGDVTVFARPIVVDIIVNNKLETLTGEIEELPIGKTGQFKIKAPLSAEDILDNEKITVGARFGKRENALVHYKEQEFEFVAKYISNTVLYGGLLVIVVAAIVLIIIFFRKREGKAHRHKISHPAPPPKK